MSTMKNLLGLKPSAPAITQYIDSLAEVAKPPVSKVPEVKSYSDAVYLNYYTLGISLLFAPRNGYKPKTGLKLNELQQDKLSLDSIDVYNVLESSDKPESSRSEQAFAIFPISPLTLPIVIQAHDKDGRPIARSPQVDITPETSGKEFVEALGEPDRKGGGTGPSSGSINIWCEWTKDGIMVEFGGAQARGAHAWEAGKDAPWKVISVFEGGKRQE